MSPKKSENSIFFPRDLQELLDYAPVGVSYQGNDYLLRITKHSSNGKYTVDYGFTDDTMRVEDGDISFQRRRCLGDVLSLMSLRCRFMAYVKSRRYGT